MVIFVTIMKKYIYVIFAALALLAVSCGGGEEPLPETEGPALVSTSPADGAGGFTSSRLDIVFTFDQYVKVPADSQNSITIDGGASVDKVSAYGTDLTVSVSGLAWGKSYTVSLAEGAVQGYKVNQKGSAPVSFRFSMVEDDTGKWEEAASAARNMGAGWNLGNTLESNSGAVDNMWIEAFTSRKTSDYETAWGQPVATRELIHMFKEAGFNAIRVPVTWYPHMGTVTVTQGQDAEGNWHGYWDMSTWKGYEVDPVWIARVKEVVGYVLDEGMYCILNVHHDTGEATTAWLRADKTVYEAVRERYCALWTQIATEFKSYGQRLVFESFNEMLDARNTWNSSTAEAHETINKYNADFVATVRATGGNNLLRNLILNTYAASPQPEALRDFRLPEDVREGHLMVEVHSYAPYLFAFDVQSGAKTVFDAGCEKEVKAIVEGLNTYLVSKGIPCVLGEYGCTANRTETEMAKQAACYVSAATKYNIPCFYWMALSDAEDRAVPKWTKPTLKDAVLKAYNDNKN